MLKNAPFLITIGVDTAENEPRKESWVVARTGVSILRAAQPGREGRAGVLHEDGARRLLDMTDNLARIIGIEALTAAQGVEFRAPLATSPALAGAIQEIRNVVPRLTDDRYMAGDLALVETLVAEDRLVRAVEAATPDAVLPHL